MFVRVAVSCVLRDFVYVLLATNRKLFIGVICPLSVLTIYTLLLHKGPGLDAHLMFIGPFIAAPLRAFAGLCLGVLTFQAYSYVERRTLLKSTKLLIDIVELFVIGLIFYNIIGQPHSPMNFLVLLLFPILLIMELSNITLLSRLTNIKLFGFLGKISLSMYLISGFAIGIFIRIPFFQRFSSYRLLYMFFYIIFDSVVAILFYNLVYFLKFIVKGIWSKLQIAIDGAQGEKSN